MNRILIAAVFAVAWPWARLTFGQTHVPLEGEVGCRGPLDPKKVVRCAVAVSAEVSEARHRLAAVGGRRIAAGVWLPSNPVVAASLSQRRRGPPENLSVLNWAVTLSQELEIAGQRGARIAVADAEAAGAARRVAVAEQEVGAAALVVFFEAAAAREALQFADDLVVSGQALADVAVGRAQEALLSGVEADVARAEAVRLGLLRANAKRRFDDDRASLALLLGASPDELQLPSLQEITLPLPEVADRAGLEARALRLRGEISAADMERQVLERRLALEKRERIPNLTFSAFAERGEIDDRIVGLGLSVPLPLPAPVGRTRAGEIAETLAQARAASSSSELVRRRVRLEVARAAAAYVASEEAHGLFASDLAARARKDLASIREALAARQLGVREVVTWQRSLIELLQADIDTRLGRLLAIVELDRVGGLPLASSDGSPQ